MARHRIDGEPGNACGPIDNCIGYAKNIIDEIESVRDIMRLRQLMES